MSNRHYSFDAMRDKLSGADSASSYGFDYDAVDEALSKDSKAKRGACEDIAAAGEFDERAMEGFRQTLNLIADQLIPSGRQAINPRALGIKLMSLLYIANPETFGGRSMKSVAEQAGISRQSITQHVLKFNQAYGYSLSWQLSPKRRAMLSAGAQARKERSKAAEALAVRLRQELDASTDGKSGGRPATSGIELSSSTF